MMWSVAALHVHRCTRIKLHDKATDKHMYKGSDEFTSEEAIKISAKRGLNIARNTVFETTDFKLCQIDDPRRWIISRFRVQAFECIKRNGIWKPHDLGKQYAIFTSDGRHFKGVCKDVSWPS